MDATRRLADTAGARIQSRGWQGQHNRVPALGSLVRCQSPSKLAQPPEGRSDSDCHRLVPRPFAGLVAEGDRARAESIAHGRKERGKAMLRCAGVDP